MAALPISLTCVEAGALYEWKLFPPLRERSSASWLRKSNVLERPAAGGGNELVNPEIVSLRIAMIPPVGRRKVRCTPDGVRYWLPLGGWFGEAKRITWLLPCRSKCKGPLVAACQLRPASALHSRNKSKKLVIRKLPSPALMRETWPCDARTGLARSRIFCGKSPPAKSIW